MLLSLFYFFGFFIFSFVDTLETFFFIMVVVPFFLSANLITNSFASVKCNTMYVALQHLLLHLRSPAIPLFSRALAYIRFVIFVTNSLTSEDFICFVHKYIKLCHYINVLIKLRKIYYKQLHLFLSANVLLKLLLVSYPSFHKTCELLY